MTLIEKIRSETKQYHDLLDRHPELSKITSSDATDNDYELYLQLFQGLHSIIEPEIEKHLEGSFPFEGRLSYIRQDLNANNFETAKVVNASFTLNTQSVFGAYYVMEGSRLGAKYIASHLRKNKQVTSDDFKFLEQKPPYSWKVIVESLNNLSPEFHSQTIEGAKDTFKFILSYVQQFYEVESK